MKKILLLIFALLPMLANAQWHITPDGVLTDSVTNQPYMIIDREGSAEDLYKEVLKNVHSIFISPDDVISTIENTMISVRGRAETTLKSAGLKLLVSPLISVKIEFKDNRMRISAEWVNVKTANWASSSITDPYTILVKGSLKCFDKKGEIKNEDRYKLYNELSSEYINRIIYPTITEDW